MAFYTQIQAVAAEYTRWTELILEKLHRWLLGAIKMTPNIVVAILAFLAFMVISRLVKKLVYRFVLRISHTPALSGLFANLLSAIITLIGLFVALDVLKLDKAVSSLLAGAGIIGLALGFAFQDLTANFISGIFITLKRPFEVGHQIETNGFTGSVEEIQLRSTRLRTLDGLHVIIPNKEIFQKPIINHSLTPERRAEITFNVPAANENALRIRELITQALDKAADVADYRSREIFFTSIDGANLKVTVTCWLNNENMRAFDAARNELIMQIIGVLKQHKMI